MHARRWQHTKKKARTWRRRRATARAARACARSRRPEAAPIACPTRPTPSQCAAAPARAAAAWSWRKTRPLRVAAHHHWRPQRAAWRSIAWPRRLRRVYGLIVCDHRERVLRDVCGSWATTLFFVFAIESSGKCAWCARRAARTYARVEDEGLGDRLADGSRQHQR